MQNSVVYMKLLPSIFAPFPKIQIDCNNSALVPLFLQINSAGAGLLEPLPEKDCSPLPFSSLLAVMRRSSPPLSPSPLSTFLSSFGSRSLGNSYRKYFTLMKIEEIRWPTDG